jgi:DNA polymerase-3 subunit gamma/tau
MAYIVLARRYRPQTLDQIIGQEHISRTLKNAIAENRVAHAYLFSGPRGVGKTTTARFLAKALNCKNGPTAEPCGECVNCQEVAAGSSVDVQEIDGASNRGIDEIRALRDNVKFAPASSKYKIYIIDEAHQITDAAFNALLKTLEEPPEHVVFILATTEPQKIPLTILSRCQRYRFRLISLKEIMSVLEKIVQKEGFKVEPAALQMIAAASGGSLRDALSLLDQAVSFVSGQVTHKDIHDLLGFLPREIIAEFSEALAQNDGAKLLGLIKDMVEQGYNLLQFGRDLRDHLRHLLLYKLNPAVLELTPEEKKILDRQHPLFTSPWLIRSGHLISKALDEMRWNDQPRLVFELYALKMAQPYAAFDELVARLDKLEQGVPFEPEAPAPVRTVVKEAPAPVYRAAKPETAAPAPAPIPAPAAEAAPEPAEAVAPVADGAIAPLWRTVVAEIGRSHPVIGGVLAEVSLQGVAGNSLMIAVSNKFQQEGVRRNQAMIEELLEKRAGRSLNLKISVDPNRAVPAAETAKEEIVVAEEEEEAPAAQPDHYQVEGNLAEMKDIIPPGLEKIVDKFPGKITKKDSKKKS